MKKSNRIEQIIRLCKEADKDKNSIRQIFYEIEYWVLFALLKLNL